MRPHHTFGTIPIQEGCNIPEPSHFYKQRTIALLNSRSNARFQGEDCSNFAVGRV
jgi:hypothetical protein